VILIFLRSRPVAANVTSNFPEFTIKVNDTKPIWGYCGQTGHCQQGMVFSINAPPSGPNTFTAFQALAKLSNATTTTTAASGYSTSGSYSGTPTEHTIVVGPNGQLAYDPPYINANPGDTVKFTFRQKNHTGAVFSFRLLDVLVDLFVIQSRNLTSRILVCLLRLRLAKKVSSPACKWYSPVVLFVILISCLQPTRGCQCD
jgi:plastocyanin